MKRNIHETARRMMMVILLITIHCSLFTARMMAQEVMVNVTPVQNVLPPQVLLYINDPGKYFNVTLTNTSAQQQDVYLALQLRQVMPVSGLSVTTPPRRQPQKPFSIPANGTRQLTMMEVKTLFNHVPSSEVSITEGLFDDYVNGSFGLLPEGDYEAILTAYRWASPQLAAPVVVSSPASGIAHLTVCYKAQAPQFLSPTPATLDIVDNSVAEVDALTPLFTWTAPVIACNPAASTFKYKFKVVEVLPNQQPDYAIEHNPTVYEVNSLLVAQCLIPTSVITSSFHTDRTYAAQVTASNASSNVLNYVMLENEGKSTYRLFKIKTDDMKGKKDDDKKDDDKKDKKDDNKKDDDENIPEDSFEWGDADLSGLISEDSLYSFSLPRITIPAFGLEDGCRKSFMGASIKTEWIEPLFRGGEGKDPYSIKFAYDVQLYCGEKVADLDAALATEPIYTKRVSELEDSIPWESIQEKVENGSYLVLRIKPIVIQGSSVAFTGDSTHIKDFALVELLTKKYFQCSNMVDITNTTPTKLSASDLKGRKVGIGEYELTIDEIKPGKAADTWQGKGHVLWEPLGFKTHVCVKFDNLKINTDNIVIDGTATSYSNNPASNMEAVDKLFSDWGIDNLISDTGIPYASELQSGATDKVKDIAKRIDLKKYYEYVTLGNAVYDALLKGEVSNLYMPVKLPKEINKSPVDIQIVSMKFAATHATMDVLGEFTLPNTDYTKNDILVLGAPRLCISPNRFLPESGTIALLSDFTINDPKSSYELTFKAPKDVITPENGTYIAWHDDSFEILGIDIDMKIPGLVKDNNGSPTQEQPILNIRTSIASWDDWMVDDITIDPFQVSALPGWTFTASDLVYDHSSYRNSDKMKAAKFPKNYDKKKAGLTGVVQDREGNYYAVDDNADWQGLFIKEIGLRFPKALQLGDSEDRQLEVSVNNMFIDKSGCSLEANVTNAFSAKTGKAGGWTFSLDKISLSFLQSEFNNCKFSGKFDVPLLDGEIGYECRIMKLLSAGAKEGQYAYVFKTQQVKNLSLDFWLAKTVFDKDQTYFLLESTPDAKGKLDTKVELMLGGKFDITIGGHLKVNLPDVHFCGMRVANCPSSWESKYEKTLQQNARNATTKGYTFISGKEFDISESGKLWFNTGKWSVASAAKKLGPFSFSVDRYEFGYENKQLKATVVGTVGLVSGINLSATAGFTILSDVTLPKSWNDWSDLDLKYKDIDFEEAGIKYEFAGMKLEGHLIVEKGNNNREGYKGNLTFHMPGDLFYIDANGGYFKDKSSNNNFTYGWFYATAGGKSGIPVTPAQIHKITAGFYFNCKRDAQDVTSAIPQKGLIGVIAGLGVSLQSAEDVLKGEFEVTVVYDRDKKRLSTFLMEGTVDAVSMIHAKANVLYQHDDKDQYLCIDVTVDATADLSKLGGDKFAGITDKLENYKKQLNSAYSGITKHSAEDGLAGKLDEKDTNKKVETNAPKSGESLSASAGAKISVQFRIAFKEKGKQLNKAKWHVYLGEPNFDNRCQFTYLKINAGIVKCDIGANGYVCVGNELPDGGKLPPIPDKISSFLNGSNSKRIESADVSKANNARENSLKEFNEAATANGGGLMFGAQVYGYFDVDLAVFYLNAGITAGFDIALIKLPANATCVNISGSPGYHGWYGYGQLYAYLYAKFGVRINLGFWKKDFDVLDAGIGGVFRMQGPKPSHFDGQARVKLKALGGIIDIDKNYRFSVGKDCDVFMGNALDNFQLFGDLSIGEDTQERGWDDKNKISPNLLTRPVLHTEAPLNESFRVLDETELAKLKKNYDGDNVDALEMEASRTFVFRPNFTGQITLYEYTRIPSSRELSDRNYNQKNKKIFNIKASDRHNTYLDITQLNPNRYYRLVVSANAKEIQKGVEVDPVTFNEQKKKYENKAWSQTKTYYFATTGRMAIPDIPELQDYIAIAYPSAHNKIKDGEKRNIHKKDLQYPTFALTTNLKDKAFKAGTLKWQLYKVTKKSDGTWKNGTKVCEVDNKWLVTDSTCNMQPTSALTGFTVKNTYRLKLIYQYSKTNEKTGTVSIATKELANMIVYPVDNTWQANTTYQYEKPFVGCRINSVTFAKTPSRYSDYKIAHDQYQLEGYNYKVYDPYLYISYLSNFAFPGGWEFTADRVDVNVITAQSLIYTDKGGVYEGKLGAQQYNYNIYNGYNTIKALSIYDRSQWKNITQYPLPLIDDTQYSYALTGQYRAATFYPNSDHSKQVQDYIKDMSGVYYAAEKFCDAIQKAADEIDNIDAAYKKNTTKFNQVDSWYNNHRGQYIYTNYNDVRLQVPCYQFPIIFGSCFENKSDMRRKIVLWHTLAGYANQCKKDGWNEQRGHQNISEYVFSGMVGRNSLDGNACTNDVHPSRDKFAVNKKVMRRMTNANFTIYRVNAYNFKDCNYTVINTNVSGTLVNGGDAMQTFNIAEPLTKMTGYVDKYEEVSAVSTSTMSSLSNAKANTNDKSSTSSTTSSRTSTSSTTSSTTSSRTPASKLTSSTVLSKSVPRGSSVNRRGK